MDTDVYRVEDAAPASTELWQRASTDFFTVAMESEHRANPYPLYAAARRNAPVYDTGFGMWLVFTHADASATLRGPTNSSDEKRGRVYADFIAENSLTEAFGGLPMMLFLDPPDHTRLRSLVAQAFTPRRAEQLRDRSRAIAADLVSSIAADIGSAGPVDLIERFAYPLPVTVICELLGVPAADHATFGEWSKHLARSVDPGILRTPDDNAHLVAAGAAFAEYFGALIDERRDTPRDDLLSAMIAAADDGDRLSRDELLGTGLLLLIAGHETTVNLIGNSIAAIASHPDQQQVVRDHGIDRAAIDELLRYDSPVQMAQRITLEPMTLGEHVVPALDSVITLLGAANRDPAVFNAPDRLDLRRQSAKPHLSFGGGIHHCLGAALARVEGEEALSELFTRFPHLKLTDGATRRNSFTLRGFDSLPVQLGPATS
jgi:pimeloyl-[acyl-carrier protein] synthase